LKQTVSAIVTITMLAGSVYLFDANSVQHAEAKETLESIKKVVAATTATAPYTILEIVPDIASCNALSLTDTSGNVITLSENEVQSMGEIGYYIGGQEASIKNLTQKFLTMSAAGSTIDGLNDAALRKDYVEQITQPLLDAGVATENATDVAPIYYSGYQEYYEGAADLTDENREKMADGTYSLISFDYSGSNGEKHIDTISGNMTAAINGNFMYHYLPEDDHTADFANAFLRGDDTTGNHFTDTAGGGEFDPHFTTVSGNYYAKFERMGDAKTGYVLNSDSVAQSWVSGNGIANETPVYTVSAGSATDNPMAAVFTYAGRTADNGNQIEDDGGDDITNDNTYYMATFTYRETPGSDGATIYRVKEFDKGSTDYVNQYDIDTDMPLVPNASVNGTVAIADSSSWSGMTEENFIYDYMEGSGNYKLTTDTSNGVHRLRGARIYCFTGYRNNDWLKQYSFDREAGTECAALNVVVNTKTAAEVTDADIATASFIMVANPDGSLILPGSTYTEYGHVDAGSVLHDISGAHMLQILARITQSNLPAILDYSLIADAASDADIEESLMYRMSQALLIEDLAIYYENVRTMTEADLHDEQADPVSYNAISANEYHFVNKSVYAYNMHAPASGASARVSFVNQYYYSEKFAEAIVTEAFADVLLDLQNENLYRTTDGNRPVLATDISEATVIRYIIGYGEKRDYNKKGTMRILEIEPCASYDLYASGVDGILYHGDINNRTELINQSETIIKLTKMTTAEFIGKVDDLNTEYDMIYVGTNTDLMNNDATGTVYNDTSMKGLVYSNVGDYIYGQPLLAGMLDSDYTAANRGGNLKGKTYVTIAGTTSRYRYSGNDITKEKMEEIKNFVAAGYPLVVADNIITTTGTSTITKTVNKSIVDDASYMYELMNAVKDKQNVFKFTNISSVLFNWYLNLSKPQIVLSGTAAEAVDNIRQVYKDSTDGLYHALYEFEVKNTGAADTDSTYDCKLYVDINADGKFSNTTEELTDFEIRHGDGSSPAKENGKYQLKTGVHYYGSCILSDAYTGVLPWELAVYQNSNNDRRMSVQGYYEIKNEKEDINVLQIDTGAASGYWNSSTWNMETTSTEAGVFKELLGDDRVRFNVKIHTITANEFNGVGTTQAAYKDYLDQYNMLVLGFADCYMEPNATAVAAIKEYIEEGRSVLFTHDTTSFINAAENQFYAHDNSIYQGYQSNGSWYYNNNRSSPDTDIKYEGRFKYNLWGANSAEQIYTGAAYWGYEFNRQIRNLVGMDRYGVLVSSSTKEKAYTPKSSRSTILGEIQGMTYQTLNLYRYAGTDKNNVTLPSKTNLAGIDAGSGQYGNEFATRVNEGQITSYPYKLDEKFKVANTHAQYYQLDLTADDDGDGESDIVVWYCISDSTDRNITDASGRDMYEMSPNDVRNNYYIYNKGNITYSGVGHSNVMSKDTSGKWIANGSDNEIKLFINTLIAAYRAGLQPPKITIQENYEAGAQEIRNIYLSYDKQLTGRYGMLDMTEDFYFKADNVSLIRSTANTTVHLAAKLYYRDDVDGTPMQIGEDTINVSELSMVNNLLYYDAVNHIEAIAGSPNDLIAGAVYRTKIPVALITMAEGQANKRELYLVISQTATNSKTGKSTVMSNTAGVDMVRVQMFNLE